MRRFTILSLMILVLGSAVGIAALRGANEPWASGLLMTTPAVFGLALIGGLCGKERSRPARLGFAVLGGGYFALTFLGLSEGNLAKLPTSKLLYFVHERVVGQATYSVVFTAANTNVSNGFVVYQGAQSTSPQGVTSTPGDMTFRLVNTAASPATPNPWGSMLPGAANYDAFQTVGHCLFALLAGLMGAVIARRFDKGRVAARAS